MKRIKLTHGKFALVDDEDFEKIYKYSWHLKCTWGIYYAMGWEVSNGKHILMHRLIMGAKKDQKIDHIDGNGLNNQRKNLRFATNSQNQANCRKQKRKTSSKFKGVCWDNRDKRWLAYIKKDQKAYRLGSFHSEIKAARIYNKKAIELFGEFARLNII